MNRMLLWSLFGLMGAGCPAPVSGVSVARDGGQYVFTIHDCGDWSGKIPVWDLQIRQISSKSSANSAASPSGDQLRCSVWADADKVKESPTIQRWIYGVAPTGFAMDTCQPLLSGNHYEIRVGARPTPVLGHFAIGTDGSVQMIDGDCKK